MRKKIIFRADGNSSIGWGHVFRLLALAEILNNEYECVFAISKPDTFLKSEIIKVCAELIDLPENIIGTIYNYYETSFDLTGYLKGNEIVVLDGYGFREPYQKEVKKLGCKLVCIDDLADCHFVADAVINHAPGSNYLKYSAKNYTKLFLGPEYLILRKPFYGIDKSKSLTGHHSIFISLGGADPENSLSLILEDFLNKENNYIINFVVSAVSKSANQVMKYSEKLKNCTTHTNLSATDIIQLMKKSGLAICSASTVALEYLNVSDGGLFLFPIAENQKHFYQYSVANHLAYDYKNDFWQTGLKPLNVELRNKLFNGRQPENLINVFKTLTKN